MLKKFFLFLAAASMIVACSDEFDDSALRGELDDLGGKVENLEQQIAQLQQAAASINAELATLQAIANGVAITKVEPVEGGFKITFSDGKSYTITNGAKGDKGDKGDKGEQGATPTNPIMRIDSDGYWQVSYDGGTTWEYPNGEKISALGAKGEQGAQGAAGATPQIGVDAEGYWTVSYDGGTTFTRLKDANGNEVKAVVSGGSSATPDSNFASVKLSDDGTMLEIVLAGETDPIRVPVGGKALVVVKSGDAAIEGVQLFQNGEKKEYTIEAAAQYMKLIGYPEGWEAVLAEKKLTVTAPAAAPAASRATADTASDISILAVLENGMAVIARVQVAIGVAEPEPEPTAGFVWDAAVWGPLFEQWASSDRGENFDFGNGLQYIAGGAKIRFAADHIQPRAAGDPAANKGLLQLTVAGPGQLVIDISSNNDNGDKNIAIALDGAVIATKVANKTSVGRKVYDIDCSAAKANSVINVYSTDGAYLLYVMKWIPGEGGSTPEPTPTALATPVVTLDPTSVEAGAEKEVAVAWAAVENAASYAVVFNGAAPVNITENAYKIDAATVKALAAGEYKVSVVAEPAPDATAYTQSAAGEATLTVTAAAPPTPPASVLEWGNDIFKNFFETKSNSDKNTEIKEDLDFGNGLKFIVGSGKCKFGSDGGMYRFQYGGSGSFDKCTLALTVSGPGTLELTIRSSNSSEERYLGVWVDQANKHVDPGFLAPVSGSDPQVHTIDCSDAKANSVINFHCLGSGINVYNIKWTPKQ